MEPVREKTKVLFVCRQNKVRSLTAEHLYRVRPDLEVRSAGTATFAKNQLTVELMEWADTVFIFDETQLEAIESRFGKAGYAAKIISLGLPDEFNYKSPNLVNKLTAKLDPYLGRPSTKPGRISLKPRAQVAAKPAGKDRPKQKSIVSQLLTAVGVSKRN